MLGLTDWLAGWLVSWLVGWLAGWLAFRGRLDLSVERTLCWAGSFEMGITCCCCFVSGRIVCRVSRVSNEGIEGRQYSRRAMELRNFGECVFWSLEATTRDCWCEKFALLHCLDLASVTFLLVLHILRHISIGSSP